jgi:hypothetical protein
MRKSGTLLTLLDGTRLRLACLGVTQPSPVVFIGISAEGPAFCYQAGPSHYAAKRVITSTALWAKCEDQSRRFDKASYSRKAARSIATGNQPANRAWEFKYGSNRRASVCIPRGSREFHTGHRWKAEAIRSKQNSPKKIKLGHYPLTLAVVAE